MNTEPTVTVVAPALATGLSDKTRPNASAAAKASRKAKPKAKAKAPAKASKKAPAKSTGPGVADLCRELGIDPRLGRAKLRRNGLSAPYNDLKKVRAILKA